MATFRISQDKENQINFRQKKDTMASQKQRAVLGLINGNKAGDKGEKGIQKPVFGVRNDNAFSNYCPPQQNKNIFNRTEVPVKTFQPFTVYEDSPREPLNDHESEEQMEVVEETDAMEMSIVEESPESKFNIHDLICPQKPVDENDVSFCDSFNTAGRTKELESEEYQTDVYKYMREIELTNRPKPGYMRKQPDINQSMRTILVDWLVEVAEEYKLHTETLYLAISFIDRFLSYMSVVRAKLQLVGTAAMYIAAKYEEVMPPDVSEFVYITDDTYSRRQVIRMEHLILKVLQFNISTPSPLDFINIITILNKDVTTPKVAHLAMYICELGLLEADPYLEYLPSAIAASGIALARHALAQDVWPQSFVETTGYTLHHLKKCIYFLDEMYKKAPTMSQKAVQEKYKNAKHYHVAKILPREENIKFPERG